MGAQLVLDSLISSHSLPIQGFYCRRNAASDSAATVRHYHWNDSNEAGVSSSVFGAYSYAHRQAKDEQRRSIQALEQPRGSEVEEQLSHVDVCIGDVHGSMGDASTWRRQRLRQQFHSQVEQRSLTSTYAQPTSWLGIDDVRPENGAGGVKDGRHGEAPRCRNASAAEARRSHDRRQPPTPRTPRLLQPGQVGNRGVHKTTISMPTCLTSLPTAFDVTRKSFILRPPALLQNETTISTSPHPNSLPTAVDDDVDEIRFAVTSHPDNDDDTASIVSSTFGHS